jgi:hypothetical protein
MSYTITPIPDLADAEIRTWLTAHTDSWGISNLRDCWAWSAAYHDESGEIVRLSGRNTSERNALLDAGIAVWKGRLA